MNFSIVFRARLTAAGVLVFLLVIAGSSARIVAARPLPGSDVPMVAQGIVIGFVGGFIAHDNSVHSEVQLAARLRKEFPTGVVVETFESYRGERAHRKILALLDTNHDGTLTTEEKTQARIIIYGHSWGGSESILLARVLEKDGIPVLLTIQVDSVSKAGSNDRIIPANVAHAANFYQSHGLIHGESKIWAADSASTEIIGNYRFDYKKSKLNCPKYPWYDKLLVKAHTQIECDPAIWDRVEELIRERLSQVAATEPAPR
jgi:hypothetical protein